MKLSTEFTQAYELYFGMKIGDQDKARDPHVVCDTCQSNLNGCMRSEHSECGEQCLYFCMVGISRFKKLKGLHDITYPDTLSSIAPDPQSEERSVPSPAAKKRSKTLKEESEGEHFYLNLKNDIDEEKKQPHLVESSKGF